MEERLDSIKELEVWNHQMEIAGVAPKPKKYRIVSAPPTNRTQRNPREHRNPIIMSTPLIDFPTIYASQPEPTGAEWTTRFNAMKPKAEKGGILVFHGNRGTGKTRMAYEIAKACIFPGAVTQGKHNRDPDPAVYRTAMMIFMELRSTFKPTSSESEIDYMNWYQDAALLVIDEIQERGETAYEDQKLTAIIDSRYRTGKTTILIGNYSKDDFVKSVSPSILSRIQESGGTVNFNWDSFRKAR
jgi:Cdc6-like AAA superfamily ATPase